MTVVVRKAKAEDGDFAVPLLLDAGERLLINILGDGQRNTAYEFLFFAWQRGSGQYGYLNHWVACIGEDVVGLVTCWHNKMPANFDRETLASITEYYGLDNAIEVVMRSQKYTIALHPPLLLELGIGHLAVAVGARRQGVASALVRCMEKYARTLGKLSLVLDVEESNSEAISFYESLGFRQQQVFSPFVQYSKGVPPI